MHNLYCGLVYLLGPLLPCLAGDAGFMINLAYFALIKFGSPLTTHISGCTKVFVCARGGTLVCCGWGRRGLHQCRGYIQREYRTDQWQPLFPYPTPPASPLPAALTLRLTPFLASPPFFRTLLCLHPHALPPLPPTPTPSFARADLFTNASRHRHFQEQSDAPKCWYPPLHPRPYHGLYPFTETLNPQLLALLPPRRLKPALNPRP